MIKNILLFSWILIATLWSVPTYFDLMMVERPMAYWLETAGFFALVALPLGTIHQRKSRVLLSALMVLGGPGFIVMMNPTSFLTHWWDFLMSLAFVGISFFTGSEFLFFSKHRAQKFRRRKQSPSTRL